MRNLKRALSLALASVMLLGMMVVGSSAAGYDDVDQEDNVEAIAVLQAVKVMNGYDDGLFHPEANVTRNQMAKIICALKGVNENDFATVRPYTDVPEWAANAVGACTAYKIVNGRGNGIYDGDANVTAIEAAAMLLRTLGYTELPLGDGWDRYVAEYASRIRLFNGINIGSNEYMNRDQIAKLTLNALESPIVDVDNNTVITMPDGTVISSGNINYVVVASSQPYASAISDAETNNANGVNGVFGTIVELGEQLYDGELKLDDEDVDDFGRPSRTWSYKSEKIGTYAKKSDLVATYTGKVTKGEMYTLLSGTVRKDLEDGDTDSAKLTVTVDGCTEGAMGGKGTSDTTGDAANWYERNSSDAIYTPRDSSATDYSSSRNGTLTEVYLDSDNNVDIVIVNTYVYQATSDYNASRNDVKMASVGDTSKLISLKTGELTLSGEDFNISGIRTNDYLLVNVAADDPTDHTDGYVVKSVKVAEKVTGEVTGYSTNDSVTIDGQKYSYSAATMKSGSGVRTTTYTVGQDAVVVLDDHGYVIAVDEAVSSSSYVFIKQFGSNSSLTTKAVASAYFTDGTKDEIDVARVNSDKSAAVIADLPGYTWYTYSINSNGDYVLYNVPSRYAAGTRSATKGAADVLIANGKVAFLPGQTTALANDDTILLLVDKEGDLRSYTGTVNMPDVKLDASKNTSVYYLQDEDGYVDYAFTDLEPLGRNGSSVVDGGEDTSFMYILKYDSENKGPNATTYWTYKTINDETGEKDVPVNFDEKLADGAGGDIKWGGSSTGDIFELFYKPRYNSDNEVTSVASVEDDVSTKYFCGNMSSPSIVTYKNGSLSLGDFSYTVNGSSKITLVLVKGSVGTNPQDLMKDKAAAYEVYAGINGETVESMLKDYAVKGQVAGATVSADTDVVDTMYITIRYAARYDFSDVEINKTSMTLTTTDNGMTAATGIFKITLPAGVTGTITSEDTSVATVDQSSASANAETTVTVTSVKNGVARIRITLTDDNGVSVTKYVTVTVTGYPAPATVPQLAADAGVKAILSGTGTGLTVTVSNESACGTLSYVWKDGGTEISGETTKTLNKNNLSVGAHTLTCEVTNTAENGQTAEATYTKTVVVFPTDDTDSTTGLYQTKSPSASLTHAGIGTTANNSDIKLAAAYLTGDWSCEVAPTEATDPAIASAEIDASGNVKITTNKAGSGTIDITVKYEKGDVKAEMEYVTESITIG